MKNDKKIEKEVLNLQSAVNEWNEYVSELGNQCAYTDRQLESILKITDKIKKLYQEEKNVDIKYYMYYVEFCNDGSQEENYDMQSKWFSDKNLAKQWVTDSFGFIADSEHVYIMTALFDKDDNYEIVKSEEIDK